MNDLIARSTKICTGIAAIGLVVMLAIVAGSILARVVFDLSSGQLNWMFSGGIEAARYALLVVLFAAFPHSLIEGLVKVDLFTERWPQQINRWLDGVWLLAMAVVALLMSFNFWRQAALTYVRGDATQDMAWPLYPFYGFIAVVSTVLGVVAVQRAWLTFSGASSPLQSLQQQIKSSGS